MKKRSSTKVAPGLYMVECHVHGCHRYATQERTARYLRTHPESWCMSCEVGTPPLTDLERLAKGLHPLPSPRACRALEAKGLIQRTHDPARPWRVL